MRVVLSCVCVCLTVTHFFSGRGALTVTTAAFFAAHPFPKGVTASGTERYPSPGFYHQGVPSFALRYTACWWREGFPVRTCRPTAGSRVHVLLRAQDSSAQSGVATNNHHDFSVSLGVAQ